MFAYVMKTKIEELIDEKLNQEFPEEVEIRESDKKELRIIFEYTAQEHHSRMEW